MTSELCGHGCGNIARYKTKDGSLRCSASSSACPEIKRKNSQGGKEAYSSGKRLSAKERYDQLLDSTKKSMAWAKGLTKETSDSVLKQSQKVKGVRRISNQTRLAKTIYREKCSFNLAGCVERIKVYELLKINGMYHKNTNPAGVVRDHRVSVNYGFVNNIDPLIISHPANCEFLFHRDNASKSRKNSCTLEELINDIATWDKHSE